MRCEGGFASFRDYDALKKTYQGFDSNAAKALRDRVRSSEEAYHQVYRLEGPIVSALGNFMDLTFSRHPEFHGRFSGDSFTVAKEDTIKDLAQLYVYTTEYGQRIHVLVWNEGEYAAIYVGNPEYSLLVPEPEKYLTYEPVEDHSNVTPAEFRLEKGLTDAPVAGIVPTDAQSAMTVAGARERLSQHELEMESLDKHFEQTRRGESPELIELKREMDRIQRELNEKRDALMLQLEEKKAEMELKKAELESQIFMLDSEIYSIECYMGETVQFTKIRSGKNAAATEPIVIHQKLRYLDEDLARLASIYQIGWGDIEMFEDFLKYSPYALDTFAPNERCIMLVRLSKNATTLGYNVNIPGIHNILEHYEVFHGRTVGIIVRNGGNLYLGWTDEDRVHIQDDFVITAAQVQTEIVPDQSQEFRSKSDRDKWVAGQIEARRHILNGLVSRAFVFSILQGIVDRTPMLPLPKGVKINKQSEYVVFSVADRWLADNKYGTFSELIKRCNRCAAKGDLVLTTQRLVSERSFSARRGYEHSNSRGRGYADRTHDVCAEDCTIYPINLVEYDEPVKVTRYRHMWLGELTEHVCKGNNRELPDDAEVIEEHEERDRHVFVSLEKSESGWRRPYWMDPPKQKARANFELYEGEYINLVYMNSVWLEYVATTKNLGGITVGRQTADYAHMIRYIKTALDFVRKREADEKAAIDAVAPGYCDAHPDWPAQVSEFKLEKGVRELNEYQAKRFAKWAVDKSSGMKSQSTVSDV